MAKVDFTVRPFHKSDIIRVVGVDRMTSPHPWDDKDFHRVNESTDKFILVAALSGPYGEEAVGYLVCAVDPHDEILGYLKMGVNPEWQCCGIGTYLVGSGRLNAGYFASERAFAEHGSPAHHNFWLKMGFMKDRETDGGVVYAKRK